MKTRIFLICMALSATAWGAEPAAGMNPAADTAAAPSTTPTEQKATAPAADVSATTDNADTQAAKPAEQQSGADAQQKSTQQSAESGFSRGSVVRSVFTSGVKDREPVDKLTSGKTDDDHIFYYTELRDMTGQTAIHRWQYKGKVVAEVKFKVRGPRWRVWSSKTIPTGDTGEWKVSVLNGAGEVIAEDMIDYTGQPAASDQSTTMEQKPAGQPAAQQPAASDQSKTMEQKPADQPAAQQPATQQPATDGGMTN